MKRTTISPRHVEAIPSELEDGVLYISTTYGTAIHRCCCGCGNRVVTPLQPGGWRLTESAGTATLSPSIGNGAFPCNSHYWIRQNRVDWTRSMTPQQTALASARDRRDAQHAADILNRQAKHPEAVPPIEPTRRSIVRRILDAIFGRK